MASTSKPRTYSWLIRLPLAVIGLILIGLVFKVMTALSQPSQFINAYMQVQKKPGQARDLMNLGILNYRQYLYLVGPVIDAQNEKNTGPLFVQDVPPVLAPATFTDPTGAVEILSHTLPLAPGDPKQYSFGQPLHMLGWRFTDSGFQLFALAASQAELSNLLYQRSENWKTTLFAQGVLLAFIVFTVFWLLNLVVLSTPSFQWVQLLIVNLIFLVLFYSVLVLSRYPLAATVLPTAEILGLANVVFAPLAMLLGRRKAEKG